VSRVFIRTGLGFAGLLLTSLFHWPARAEQPSYSGFKETAYLQFLRGGDDGLRRPPSLGLSFGARVHRATLDTGSTGVVVGSSSIPNVDRLPKAADGELTYTSSGRIMRGRWVKTSFTIVGAEDNAVQTEDMPVLAVDRVDCLPRARDCDPTEDVSHIAMIGIGFAREHDRQSQSTPDKNPLLHVVSDANPQRKGYVLTSEGIHIGLSPQNTADSFTYIKLERNSEGTDWSPLPTCISINGKTPPACGTLLVDSGVGAAFVTLPMSQASGKLITGDQVAVTIPQGDTSIPLYSFKVGDESPVTPGVIHLRNSPERVFLNTSFKFLNGFDVLYDADGGYAGFRRR
jgi:hypothetical protein